MDNVNTRQTTTIVVTLSVLILVLMDNVNTTHTTYTCGVVVLILVLMDNVNTLCSGCLGWFVASS